MEHEAKTQPEMDTDLSSEQLLAQLHSEDYQGSELMDLLYQIESVISSARNVPMSASVFVNRAEMLALLESARDAIPADIQTANQIVTSADALVEKAQQESGQILDSAQQQAEQIIAAAHQQAEQLIEEQRIVVMARERADQIVEAATQRAQELAAGADKYCDTRLAELEESLTKQLAQVTAGRKLLAGRENFDPAQVGESAPAHADDSARENETDSEEE